MHGTAIALYPRSPASFGNENQEVEDLMAQNLMPIEQRLSSLESAVTQVQQKLGIPPSSGNWVDVVSGSLADIPEEDYQRFLDCCRAVRNGVANSQLEEGRQ